MGQDLMNGWNLERKQQKPSGTANPEPRKAVRGLAGVGEGGLWGGSSAREQGGPHGEPQPGPSHCVFRYWIGVHSEVKLGPV